MDLNPYGAGGADYCQAVETYLCRKNDGHLVRIVGPAFECVCAWAERGVPLKVAFRGIDRYFERYYAKGPRRRPVRIEFCEADVLDVFDEWRRAVGVSIARETREPAGPDVEAAGASPLEGYAAHRPSLPAHLERVIARLVALRAGAPALDRALEEAIRRLDAARADATTARGAAREAIVAELRGIDAALLEAGRTTLDSAAFDEMSREAEAQLAPFRPRMPEASYETARAACVQKLLRDRLKLPNVVFE